MAIGHLVVNVFAEDIAQPVEGATVTVKGENTLRKYKSDSSGKTPLIELYAPEKEYSLTPQTEVRPYSLYEVKVSKEGMTTYTIENVEVLPEEISLQNVFLTSKYMGDPDEITIKLPEHGLWGDFDPKIPEEPIKDLSQLEIKDERVLPFVVIPEYIIVQDGIPSNANAPKYNVSFPDYIKNVASSEIYSTWPRETIKANVHAILSFTLNRIFTEWYRANGYNFTITSSPAYDQQYTHNRTIFKSIADVVDEIFNYYIKLPNVVQPFLAQYNDGIKTNNPGWLSQWGSKALGDQGYTAINILKYYYINTLTLQQAQDILGLPSSFPGYNLQLGSCGEPVQKKQIELNKIRGSFPALPVISPADGQFNQSTKTAVEAFQRIFDLPVTGIINFSTWYEISYKFAAVSKMLQGIVG